MANPRCSTSASRPVRSAPWSAGRWYSPCRNSATSITSRSASPQASAAGSEAPITVRHLHLFGSEYNSRYIAFTPVEWATNQPGNDFFGLSPLQSLTLDQAHLVDTYNPFCQRGGFEAGGGCPVPFVDVGNRYIGFTGTDRSYITGLTWWPIASGLSDPSLTRTKALDGAAALLIGQICGVTDDRPSEVCKDPVIQRYKWLDNGQG